MEFKYAISSPSEDVRDIFDNLLKTKGKQYAHMAITAASIELSITMPTRQTIEQVIVNARNLILGELYKNATEETKEAIHKEFDTIVKQLVERIIQNGLK